MSQIQFRRSGQRAETLLLVKFINKILAEYDGQRLTARQVYYRLVAADAIPNNDKSYKRLTGLLTDARYAGLVSWDIIEDRGRVPQAVQEWDSIEQIVDAAMRGFCKRRWAGQPNYLIVMVEKQALAGVLWPICAKWHVTLMVNKGYSSASAMKELADTIMDECGQERHFYCKHCGTEQDPSEFEEDPNVERNCDNCFKPWDPECRGEGGHREPHVLYLGDFDPSGEDMVRDVRDRLTEFGVADLTVEKIGLTMPQIKRLNPPPNPAKITDSRAAAYIEQHGEFSWELDALPPRELSALVNAEIAALCDGEMMDEVKREEAIERERLTKAMAKAFPKPKVKKPRKSRAKKPAKS